MGCGYSERDSSQKIEEDILIPLEKSLGFYLNTSKFIVSRFNIHSINSKFSLNKLEAVCSELQINYKIFSDVFGRLAEKNKTLNTKWLSCLGILLGKGDCNEKTEILFKIYSKDGILEKNDITAMCEDLIYLTCVCIPNAALLKDLKNLELNTYCNKLQSFCKALAVFFGGQIIKTNEAITFSEFIRSFDEGNIYKLLETSKLRAFAIKECDGFVGNLDAHIQNIDEKYKKIEKQYKIKLDQTSELDKSSDNLSLHSYTSFISERNSISPSKVKKNSQNSGQKKGKMNKFKKSDSILSTPNSAYYRQKNKIPQISRKKSKSKDGLSPQNINRLSSGFDERESPDHEASLALFNLTLQKSKSIDFLF